MNRTGLLGLALALMLHSPATSESVRVYRDGCLALETTTGRKVVYLVPPRTSLPSRTGSVLVKVPDTWRDAWVLLYDCRTGSGQFAPPCIDLITRGAVVTACKAANSCRRRPGIVLQLPLTRTGSGS